MSQTEFVPSTPSIKSRRIAILVADGFDLAVVEGIKAVIKAGGALPFIIGPRRGEIYPAGKTAGKNSGLMADHHFEGQRSTMFDALFIPSGAEHVKSLMGNGRVKQWVLEAFGHLKAIGAVGEDIFSSVHLSIGITSYLILIFHISYRISPNWCWNSWCQIRTFCGTHRCGGRLWYRYCQQVRSIVVLIRGT